MIATLKHFPGHGDTDVDSHLGLPIIKDPRESLDQTEFPPFRAGIAAGAGAVMTAHIEMPSLDPAPNTPTTLSGPIVSGRAAARDGLRRPGLHRLDGHGRRDEAVQARRSRRPRDQSGQRHRPPLARRRRRVRGTESSGAGGGDSRGSARRVGRTHPACEGPRRTASQRAP